MSHFRLFFLLAAAISQVSFVAADDKIEKPIVIAVHHSGPTAEGWKIAQTSHFKIFHKQQQVAVEKIAVVAETTRLKITKKWFASDGDAWSYPCELTLYANGESYQHMTGVTADAPGHSTIESDWTGRVVGRRMHMRQDATGLIDAVLPHETTHVVLAGQFGLHAVPRWADEGIAVLSETEKIIAGHRRNLKEYIRAQDVFSLKELMEMKDYPPPSRMRVFYAQSVCVTDFMAKEQSPVVFTKFIRVGLDKGYEISLQRHYGCNFAGLEERWQKFLAKEKLIGP